MPITTKTGDDGYSRWQGKVVAKDSTLLACIGDLDELQAFLGLLKSKTKKHVAILNQIQTDLWGISGCLAYGSEYLDLSDSSKSLENYFSVLEAKQPPLSRFVLPGSNINNSLAHICRTIARRTERSIVTLSRTQKISSLFLIYLNRISDFLFILSRDADLVLSKNPKNMLK